MPLNACSTIYAAVSVEAVEICMPFWLNMNKISGRPRSAECENWISGIMTFHLHRQTSPFIEEFLTKACSLSVSVVRSQVCKEDPELVCQLLGDEILDNAKTTPKTSVMGNVPSAVNANVISCGSCVYVTNKIKNLLALQRVEDNIENVIYTICEYMTDSKDTCNTVVHTDVRAFIRFLSHEVDAHGICSFLRFCEPTEEEKQAPLCPFCEYVIDRIQGELISNSSVAQITTVMQQVCVRVTHWNDVCREVVQADAPALINYLVRHMDVRHICERLQFCPSHQNFLGIEQLSVTSLESTTCVVCKPVVQALKHFLDRNSTKEEIALLLDLLCDLTVKYKQHCQQVVSEYLPQMIELLEKNADPELVCELLGLCSPIDNTTKVLVTREPNSGNLCPFCVYLLHRLRNENKNDLSFPNLQHALVRLCPMTGPMMYDCQKIIKGNERIIAKRMELAESDRLICQTIRICSRNSFPTEEVDTYKLKTEMPTVFSELIKCASILANNSFYVTPVTRNITKGRRASVQSSVKLNNVFSATPAQSYLTMVAYGCCFPQIRTPIMTIYVK
ncbi:hypothetical protein EG68_02901 [Paragonimus skrjabini miyazakii]|uniref:Saposin B-type domain-containing protein n=1 Tax=Paragonimus skrjabini miyazakii TaxID=59628 RepID=A0A8S9YVT1_9TREM|nr:hypothetical protein EG68_02901 [Paragonimus skrjabini miyazakii]